MRVGVFLSTLSAVVIGFVTGAVTITLVAPELFGNKGGRKIPEAVTASIVSAGDFSGADGLYRAKGRAQVLDGGDVTLLRFTDFAVSNGPDQEVWLISDGSITSASDIRAEDVLSLGRLKSQLGDQVYLVPDGVDPRDYPIVAIWGAQFATLYATAALDG